MTFRFRKHLLWLSLLTTLTVQQAIASGPLTFEERVKAREAIERVYYARRIWPKENPGAKPPFEQLVTRAQIERKVTEYLKKSLALDEFWHRPIEAPQLQAEMDRMTKGSKDPATLREMFAALNNDPILIAECLARPILADRLARSWYANDERFHSEAKAKAEAALASSGGGSLSLCPDGRFEKATFILREPDEMAGPEEGMNSGEIALDAKAFARELERSPEEGKASILKETPEAFLLVRTTLKTPARLGGGEPGFRQGAPGELAQRPGPWFHPAGRPSPSETVLAADSRKLPAREHGTMGFWTMCLSPEQVTLPSGRGRK